MRTVSKKEFARLTNVTSQRVSQWIAERRIYGDAFEGEGRHARIRPGIACEQLRRTLDPDQRLANGTAKLDADDETVADAGSPGSRPPTLEEKIRIARLEALSRANRLAAAEEAERAGRYVAKEEAARNIARAVSRVMTDYEAWLYSELGATLAVRFDCPLREIEIEIQSQHRAFRARIAEKFWREAKDLPELVADSLQLGSDESDVKDAADDESDDDESAISRGDDDADADECPTSRPAPEPAELVVPALAPKRLAPSPPAAASPPTSIPKPEPKPEPVPKPPPKPPRSEWDGWLNVPKEWL
jgi:hypothetical protein